MKFNMSISFLRNFRVQQDVTLRCNPEHKVDISKDLPMKFRSTTNLASSYEINVNEARRSSSCIREKITLVGNHG